jgi:hypothetical protein
MLLALIVKSNLVYKFLNHVRKYKEIITFKWLSECIISQMGKIFDSDIYN